MCVSPRVPDGSLIKAAVWKGVSLDDSAGERLMQPILRLKLQLHYSHLNVMCSSTLSVQNQQTCQRRIRCVLKYWEDGWLLPLPFAPFRDCGAAHMLFISLVASKGRRHLNTWSRGTLFGAVQSGCYSGITIKKHCYCHILYLRHKYVIGLLYNSYSKLIACITSRYKVSGNANSISSLDCSLHNIPQYVASSPVFIH